MATRVIGAAVVFAIGTYIGGQWRARDSSKAGNPAPTSDQSALAGLRDENRRLREQLEQVRADRTQSLSNKADAVPSVRSEWRALANLQTQKIAQSRLTVVGRTGQLHDTFVTLFDLPVSERESLQVAVDRATERLAALEAQNASVSRDEKGVVTIHVKPFPGAGGVVYDELMRTFLATLGQERYGAFVILGAEQVERALANCGAQERIVRISYDPRREKIPYVVKDEFKMGPRENAQETSTFQRRDEISARIGSVARLLPPDWGVEK